ncbi:DUF5309 domain-containing protein [Candidatus Pacearchaeota archaeon]|jgi:hypothetical protein|nr:DUF5309 domain-containing protein [Candidatus Pacearchaeota archaeon]
MANTDHIATSFITPQYVGALIQAQGAVKTSFLNRLGGIGSGGAKRAKGWTFAMNSHNALDSSAQKSITENDSLTVPTARNYDRGQDTQVCQIFQYGVGATWGAESDLTKLSGIAVAGEIEDVNDPLASNLNMTILQAAQDIEYHMLRGLYQTSSADTTAYQMRGMFSRTVQGGGAGVTISTHDVDAGGDALAVADVDALMLAMMETNPTPVDNLTIVGRYSAIKKLTDLYGVTIMAGPNNNIGTANGKIDTIATEAGVFPIMVVPQMPALTLGFVDFSKISIVFLPVPEKADRPGGYFFYTPLARTGAADQGQLYGQVSIDIGAEEFHGQIWHFT